MSHQLTINYPETFPDALQQTRKQFEPPFRTLNCHRAARAGGSD